MIEPRYEDDVPTFDWMRLADQGGAFDFWHDDGEAIYSAQDGEPIAWFQPSPSGDQHS